MNPAFLPERKWLGESEGVEGELLGVLTVEMRGFQGNKGQSCFVLRR